ncbi:type VII secretion-associated protein, partial [Actinomycetospora chlora]|uniref:type VII secretion-associated protein n=1 Tax=Actinomycetospora chlora TaxID=663608 RepID=UPI0031E86565
ALLAVAGLPAEVVLGGRAQRGESGTPTVVGGQAFVAPLGWVTAGGDAAARRILLRPAGAPRGTDLVAVQENPLDPAAAADPERARGQLAAQYEAARAAGDPVSDYDPRAEFGDRDVARYRQDPAPGVRVDWFVVVSAPSMVSVGCRHGTDDAEARRVLAACAQVVETLTPAG